MFQTEEQVIAWIEKFGYSKGERTLDHLYPILKELGDPHLKIKTIHVAGTNGKGSTVAFLREVLMAAKYQVGTFTSPHIIRFGERMAVNSVSMREEDLVKYGNRLRTILEVQPNLDSFASFDVITLLSFVYFSEVEDLDLVLYEAGIGGRVDSTNVIVPLVSAITNIGNDHAEILGKTKLERAGEKAGIIKQDVPLFTTEEDPILLAKFKSICERKGASFHQSLDQAKLLEINDSGVTFNWSTYKDIKLSMHGEHQFKNATLALSIINHLNDSRQLKVSKDDIYVGLQRTWWQGRFEHMQKKPPVVLDGAHNLEGIVALIETLKRAYPQHKKKFIFSALQTKDTSEMLEIIKEVATHITFTKGNHPGAQDGEVMYDRYNDSVNSAFDNNYQAVVKSTVDTLETNEILVICGSLYFISDVRHDLFERNRWK